MNYDEPSNFRKNSIAMRNRASAARYENVDNFVCCQIKIKTTKLHLLVLSQPHAEIDLVTSHSIPDETNLKSFTRSQQ